MWPATTRRPPSRCSRSPSRSGTRSSPPGGGSPSRSRPPGEPDLGCPGARPPHAGGDAGAKAGLILQVTVRDLPYRGELHPGPVEYRNWFNQTWLDFTEQETMSLLPRGGRQVAPARPPRPEDREGVAPGLRPGPDPGLVGRCHQEGGAHRRGHPGQGGNLDGPLPGRVRSPRGRPQLRARGRQGGAPLPPRPRVHHREPVRQARPLIRVTNLRRIFVTPRNERGG